MKPAFIRFSALATGVVTFLLLAGCGKKSDDSSTVTTPTAVQPDQPTAASVAPTPRQSAAPDVRLAESQAAINSGDYEKAATALITAQQTRLSQQQAEALAKQMQQLQGNLAAGVANGDPRAIAAANKLRQSATVR